MSQYDPEHPYSEEATRAQPRIDPWVAQQQYTQPMDGSSGTSELRYGSPPPQYGYDQGSSRAYGYDQSNSQPSSYGQPAQQNTYGRPDLYGTYGANYGAPNYSYAPPGGFVQPKPTNGLAIAALACGLGGFLCGFTSILAIIFGFMALPDAKRHNDGAAKGMAIAGIALGFVVAALTITYIVVLVTAGTL